MSALRLFGWFLGLCLILCIAFAAAVYQYTENAINTELNLPPEGSNYWLKPGTSMRAMARELHVFGILEKPLAMLLWARSRSIQQRLVAGEYHLPTGTTARGLLDILSSGRVMTHKVTLIEGTTALDGIQALYKAQLKPTLALLNNDAIKRRLGLENYPSIEGLLYPDTYFFHRGMSELSVLLRAKQAMLAAIDQEWSNRAPDLPYKTPYEALILASIVEKETAVGSERSMIAGVLIRRLRRGMRLEADPTTIYGLGSSFDGNLTRAHLADSTNPYNTYRISGLPPTPIALVSRASLHAALHPDSSNNLFFVARGDGSHFFSDTIARHRKAVRRYQLNR